MSTRRKAKMPSLRYFFYNDKLHRKLHINRAQDIITAWCYEDGKTVTYAYSDVRRKGERAFTTPEVATMIQRTRRSIFYAIADGNITPPSKSYGLDENKNEFGWYWNQKKILELHAYYSTVHKGRPRKDGRVTPAPMPTRAELLAMIRQGTVLYAKDEDGNFVPTWQANGF